MPAIINVDNIPPSMLHPQESGFSPRYHWEGRERAITWTHCKATATSKEIAERFKGQVYLYTHYKCPLCGHTNETEG